MGFEDAVSDGAFLRFFFRDAFSAKAGKRGGIGDDLCAVDEVYAAIIEFNHEKISLRISSCEMYGKMPVSLLSLLYTKGTL